MIDCYVLKKGRVVATQIILFCVLLVSFQEYVFAQNRNSRIILDTDISSDVDDVGAVSVLHALADKGDVEILAMMVSSGDLFGGACLDALNTSFGRPDIPVGTIKDPTVNHTSKYTQHIAENYPHNFHSNVDIPDAVYLYRKILASQPDMSVTIVSVGYLSNLSRLLQSNPDEYSALNGTELVLKKVKSLVCMGGNFPTGREWNLYQDVQASSFVVSKWPTPINFCGFEIGNKVLTGKALNKVGMNHPLRKAYQLYNSTSNRQSWDQVAVLLAAEYVDNNDVFWNLSISGEVRIDKDGKNTWKANEEGLHKYMVWSSKSKQLSVLIDNLMLSSVNGKLPSITE